jgi:D-proline reductase (dithiol) PrdB
MQRTRDWYLALGYDNPYEWAHHDDAPFQRLGQPLSRSRVAIVTTAAPWQPDKGPQGAGAPYNAAAKFYRVWSADASVDPDLRIAHVGIDRRHANMVEQACWFPLQALRETHAQGRIGEVAPRFHGLPTNRSQRHTLEVDAPELLARCREDRVDAVLLVPNCPVCHQSVSLAARSLEAAGIATVVLGAAKDIVEYCGVPRFVFSDFPLGNAAARPGDVASRGVTLGLALDLLESARAPRTTVHSPLRWAADDDWKLDYCNAQRLDTAELARLRAENERARLAAREIRNSL